MIIAKLCLPADLGSNVLNITINISSMSVFGYSNCVPHNVHIKMIIFGVCVRTLTYTSYVQYISLITYVPCVLQHILRCLHAAGHQLIC